MVQGAVYDALNAIDRGHRPYLRGLPRASRTGVEGRGRRHRRASRARRPRAGAAAGRARPAGARCTRPRWPAPTAGRSRDKGIAAGAAAAGCDAGRDGRTTAATRRSRSPSRRRRTGEGGSSPHRPPTTRSAWVAKVRPFGAAQRLPRLRTSGPLSMCRAQIRDASFDEVKALGAATGSTRTPEQTALAQFYTDHPVPLWNRAFRTVGPGASGLGSGSTSARLLAMVDAAGGRRPDRLLGRARARRSVLAPDRRDPARADEDGNPSTTADPAWSSLIGGLAAVPGPPVGLQLHQLRRSCARAEALLRHRPRAGSPGSTTTRGDRPAGLRSPLGRDRRRWIEARDPGWGSTSARPTCRARRSAAGPRTGSTTATSSRSTTTTGGTTSPLRADAVNRSPSASRARRSAASTAAEDAVEAAAAVLDPAGAG